MFIGVPKIQFTLKEFFNKKLKVEFIGKFLVYLDVSTFSRFNNLNNSK